METGGLRSVQTGRASDTKNLEAVENIEEKLGYELEKPDEWSEVREDGEEMKETAETAKQAGFINGEFRAR